MVKKLIFLIFVLVLFTACTKQEVSRTETNITCTLVDGGITLTMGASTRSFQNTCQDEKSIIEWSCNQEGKVLKQIYACPGKCENNFCAPIVEIKKNNTVPVFIPMNTSSIPKCSDYKRSICIETNLNQKFGDRKKLITNFDSAIFEDGIFVDRFGLYKNVMNYSQVLSFETSSLSVIYERLEKNPSASFDYYLPLRDKFTIFSYELNFQEPVRFDVFTDPQKDLRGTSLTIMDINYTLYNVEVFESKLKRIYFANGEKLNLSEEEFFVKKLDDGERVVKVLPSSSDTVCKLSIDKNITFFNVGESKKVNDIYVTLIDFKKERLANTTMTKDHCSLVVGDRQVILWNGREVSANEKTLPNTYSLIKHDKAGYWSGFKINYNYDGSGRDLFLSRNQTWQEPIFNAIELKFVGESLNGFMTLISRMGR